MTFDPKDLLATIQFNVAKYGFHVTLVPGATLPRFAYTIGARELIGFELVLAGGTYYSANEVKRIISQIVSSGRRARSMHGLTTRLGSLGSFSLSPVDQSWVTSLMLGAVEYHGSRQVASMQIVPDPDHSTLDVPAMEAPWNASEQPVWRWVGERWTHPISPKSVAVTNCRPYVAKG